MYREEIIREEAANFAFHYVEHYALSHEGHKKLIEQLRLELKNYYSPDAKMIFLDQVKDGIEAYRESGKMEHQNDPHIEGTYDKMLFFVQQEIDELPKIIRSGSGVSSNKRMQVFISYSHKDKPFLDDLKRHFKPLKDSVDFWDDSAIAIGQRWKEQIKNAIEKTKVAILLLSADFFNSEFIENHELPTLLKKAQTEGATILTVILKPCLFEEYPELNQYQALNSPTRPISSLDETSRELMWVELVRQVKKLIDKKLIENANLSNLLKG